MSERAPNWCHRWNEAHPWDHDAHHHDRLLRRLPERVGAAPDVGCGTGDLARRLAQRSRHVTGIDSDPPSIRTAQRLSTGTGEVEFLCGEAMTADLPGGHDVITALAVLHRHLFWRCSLLHTAP
ncbi:class I SAM-dependent methyltransferase [Kineococcus sp. NUM-3379]